MDSHTNIHRIGQYGESTYGPAVYIGDPLKGPIYWLVGLNRISGGQA